MPGIHLVPAGASPRLSSANLPKRSDSNSRDSVGSSGSTSQVVSQPYYSTTYLPPSPPRSRSPSPYSANTSTGLERSNSNGTSARLRTSTVPPSGPTTHWNDLPASMSVSTATQRKGSIPPPANGDSSNVDYNAPMRIPLRASPQPSSNGYPHHYQHETIKDTQMTDFGYSNGGGGHQSPVQDTFSPSVNGAAPFVGQLYNRASEAIKGAPRSSLPVHQQAGPSSSSSSSSNLAPSHAHARRKSIAQAVVPSISTVRFVTLCGLWYTSSAVSNNTGKSILNRFRYPVTLTFIQFGFVAGWCVIFCVGRVRIQQMGWGRHVGMQSSHGHGRSMSMSKAGGNGGWGIQKPGRKALQGTVVMSLFQIAGHIFSSMATARIPVSTVHTIKALSPLFTVMSYGLLFRVRYSYNTYLSLLPLTLGVMLACSFDLRANAAGLVCALGSTIIFVSQNIFSKKLLPKDGTASSSSSGIGEEKKLDKLHLLLYSSGIAFLGMIPIWIYYDAYTVLFSATRTATIPTLAFYLTINGSVHFLQNLLAFSILSLTSPVTYSIASLIKRIAVICLAIIWFGQTVYPLQAVGISLTAMGLWMYNLAKKDVERGEERRVKVEKRGSMVLPTSREDLSDSEGFGGGGKSKGWSIVR